MGVVVGCLIAALVADLSVRSSYLQEKFGQRHHAHHRTETQTATRPAKAFPARNWNPLQHPQPISAGKIFTTQLR